MPSIPEGTYLILVFVSWQPNLSNKALMDMCDIMDVYMTVSQQPSQIVVFVL